MAKKKPTRQQPPQPEDPDELLWQEAVREQQRKKWRKDRKQDRRLRKAREAIQPNTRAKKVAFLKAYKKSGVISQACRDIGVCRRLFNQWAERDPHFKFLFDQANEEVTESLEKEAIFRATKGLRRYKFDKHGQAIIHPVTGEPYYETVRSDTLLIFLLKARRPDVYREVMNVIQQQGVSVQQLKEQVEAMDATILPPSEAARLLIESHQSNSNGNGNGKVH